jgi:signal transduction histidine kinase
MFFSRTHKYQLALQNLAVEAPTMVNINELSERIVSTLIENMGMSKAAIIISQSAYAENEFDLLHHEGFSEEQCSAFITPTAELMNAFHSSRMTYVKDELQVELLDPELSPKVESFIRHTQHALEVADASIVLSLKVRDTLLGFLVLGNKTRGSFTVEDISLLEEISNQLAVALMHSRMHEEKTVLTRMLREEVSQATNAWKEKSLENEELSNVKSQFIEVASHQLRTPISVIRNSVQMVLDDYLAEQDIPEELQQIVPLLRNAFLASDNLNNSINSILAAEEFIDKKPHVHVERVNLESFLQRRVRRAKALIDAKSASEIVLKTDIAADVPEFIVTDEEKTAMILDQLLMNAVLYTTEGDVTLKVTIKNEHIEFSISDTGIGIPESEEGTIFERFVRLKGAQRVVPDGTGLGLYLAKEYSNLLRGQLRFTSEEGDGSTFIVSIPVQYSYV